MSASLTLQRGMKLLSLLEKFHLGRCVEMVYFQKLLMIADDRKLFMISAVIALAPLGFPRVCNSRWG